MSENLEYLHQTEAVTEEDLQGFFEGWPDPPSPETHLRLLEGSDEIVLAVDPQTGEIAGFVTAVTDGVLSAYIPLLEVKPAWRGRGIATELVRRLLERLSDLYMVDLVCDEDLVAFYERFGMQRANAMILRRYEDQPGRVPVSPTPEPPTRA